MKKTILIFFIIFTLFGCSLHSNNTRIINQRITDFWYWFLQVDDKLFHEGTEIKDIDTHGIQVYSSSIFANTQGVYYIDRELKKISTNDDFKFIGQIADKDSQYSYSQYYVVNNQVYYNKNLVKFADPNTFKTKVVHVENNRSVLLWYDKYGVYYNWEFSNYKLQDIQFIDPKDDLNNVFPTVVRDVEWIWFGDKLKGFIDADSFEKIWSNIYRDKNNIFCIVFWEGFTVLESKLSQKLSNCYEREFWEKIQDSINPDDYIVLNQHYFISKKTGNLYFNRLDSYFSISQVWNISEYENIDYKFISPTTLMINNQVFFHGVKRLEDVQWSDLNWWNFETWDDFVEYQWKIYGGNIIDWWPIERFYNWEKERIYFYDEEVDINQLEKISAQLYKHAEDYYDDIWRKVTYYYDENSIQQHIGLDEQSYQLINNNYFFDKNHLYWNYEKIYDL